MRQWKRSRKTLVCGVLAVCFGLNQNPTQTHASGPFGTMGMDPIAESSLMLGPPNLLKRWKKQPAKKPSQPASEAEASDAPQAPAAQKSASSTSMSFSSGSTSGGAKPVRRAPGVAPTAKNSEVMRELQKLYEQDGMPMPQQYVVPVRPKSQTQVQSKIVRRSDGSIIVPPQKNQFTSFIDKINPFKGKSKSKTNSSEEATTPESAPVVSAPPAQPSKIELPQSAPPKQLKPVAPPKAVAASDDVLFDFDSTTVVQKASPKPEAAPVSTTPVNQLPVLSFDFDSDDSLRSNAKPEFAITKSEPKVEKAQEVLEPEAAPAPPVEMEIVSTPEKPAPAEDVVELPKTDPTTPPMFPIPEQELVAKEETATPPVGKFPTFPTEESTDSKPTFPVAETESSQGEEDLNAIPLPQEMVPQEVVAEDSTPRFPVAETETKEPETSETVEIVPGKDARPMQVAKPEQPKALPPAPEQESMFPVVADTETTPEPQVDFQAPAVLESDDPAKPPVPNPARDGWGAKTKVAQESPFLKPDGPPVEEEAEQMPAEATTPAETVADADEQEQAPKLIADVATTTDSPAKPMPTQQEESFAKPLPQAEVESVVESATRPQFAESSDGFEQPFMQPIAQPTTAHTLPQPKVVVPQSTDGWKRRTAKAPTAKLSESHVPVMTASLKPALEMPKLVKPVSIPKVEQRDENQQKYDLIRGRKALDGLKGFCPVALRETRELIDSSNQHMTVYRGTVYKLSSAEALERFEADPEVYAPAFAGYDVVSLYDNKHVKGKLDHALWYNSSLYLFGSTDSVQRFREEPSKFIPEK